LVADDWTLVWTSGGGLFARAPATLAGLVEARGLGVVPAAALDWARLFLVVDLVVPEAVERMPEPASAEVCGIAAPLIALCAHDSAATAKLALALDAAFPCAATSLGVAR
jgi:serine kinase of HPr protein (carbohydrate metabolism regulator)